MTFTQQFRDAFTMDASLIYLNSGTESISPNTVQRAADKYRAEYELNPTYHLLKAWGLLWESQKQIAHFFNATPEDLFLTSNVTLALNTFILGHLLPANSEILFSNLEYPAIVNTGRYRAQRDGLTYREFNLSLSLKNDDEVLDTILKALSPKTKMLVLSHVFTGTGLVLPVAELARHTRNRGIALVIDGAHSVGALNVDFSKLEDVDFYGANLHKWMLGSKGTGFGWAPKRTQHSLAPLSCGWTTFEIPQAYADFGDGHHFPLKHSLNGCHDFAPFVALSEMVQFWKTHGAENIRKRIFSLQDFLEKTVQETLGWKRVSPDPKFRGPLLTFHMPEVFEKKGFPLLLELYEKYRLQVAVPLVQGQWCMRFAPHIYNTEEEISRAALILKEASAKLAKTGNL